MLRLERGTKYNINIRKYEKRSLFNPGFVRILAAVCFLHLLSFFIFDIEETIPFEDKPHSPTQVTPSIGSGLQTETQISMAEVDVHGLLLYYLQEPKLAAPTASSFPELTLLSRTTHEKDLSRSSNVFEQIERRPYQAEPLDISLDFSPPPVAIYVSGPLEGFGVKPYKVNEQILQDISGIVKGFYRCVFRVQVDERAGRIFWYSLEDSSGIDVLDDSAEACLKSLEFNISREGSILEGRIDVVFSLLTLK